ncbi:host cell division inhibitor Icd-like protein [Buttiauxella gaviniae]|uniref:host cell division inhibitor Icd-like protein n=1 Tax=Buttiauxella gaviniae TaxID=82990 RepID=UPI0039AF15E1
MAESQHTQTHPKKVVLPYVGAVNPKADPFIQALQRERLDMLESFKAALEAAGAAYIDGANMHNQLPAKFTWRFLSISARSPEAKPIVIYVNASSEHEARDTMPGVRLIFSARLPFHAFQALEARYV